MEYPFYGCKMKQVNARNENKKKFGSVGEGYWFCVARLPGTDFMAGDAEEAEYSKCREGNAFRILSGYDSFISKSKMCRG